jgi:hypothetical protein
MSDDPQQEDATPVTVYRGTDPIQAQILKDLLLENGFDARLLGTRNASLLGAGQLIFQQRIEVPAFQAQEAEALVEAFQVGGEGELEGFPDPETDDDDTDEGDPEPAEEEPSEPRPVGKSRVLAAGIVWVLPGASHLYARRPWTAGCLLACFVVGMMTALNFGTEMAGAALMVGALLGDLVGGQLAVAAFNRGRTVSLLGQLLQGALIAAILASMALLVHRSLGMSF